MTFTDSKVRIVVFEYSWCFSNQYKRNTGILCMEGYERQFVVQGIHMLFNGEQGPEWAQDEERRSRLVFIGLHLPQRDLRRGFESCIVSKKQVICGEEFEVKKTI